MSKIYEALCNNSPVNLNPSYRHSHCIHIVIEGDDQRLVEECCDCRGKPCDVYLDNEKWRESEDCCFDKGILGNVHCGCSCHTLEDQAANERVEKKVNQYMKAFDQAIEWIKNK